MAPVPGPLKVLYVMGYPRCGSTMVNAAFGSCRGFVGVGELRYLWYPQLSPTRVCGCGAPVTECELWTTVARLDDEQRPGGSGVGDPQVHRDALARLQTRLSRRRRFLPLLRGAPAALADPDLATYLAARTRSYRSIATAGGGHVVVDSSKFPYDAVIVQHAPGIELYVVHLMRDPRGSLCSRLSGTTPKARRLRPVLAITETVTWLVSVGAARLVVKRLGPERSRVMRYEDFVADPETEMRIVLDWMGEESVEPPVLDEHWLRLEPVHQVSGNRIRSRHGDVELTEDDRWRRDLARPYRWLITAGTVLTRRRYGYR